MDKCLLLNQHPVAPRTPVAPLVVDVQSRPCRRVNRRLVAHRRVAMPHARREMVQTVERDAQAAFLMTAALRTRPAKVPSARTVVLTVMKTPAEREPVVHAHSRLAAPEHLVILTAEEAALDPVGPAMTDALPTEHGPRATRDPGTATPEPVVQATIVARPTVHVQCVTRAAASVTFDRLVRGHDHLAMVSTRTVVRNYHHETVTFPSVTLRRNVQVDE